MMSKLQLGPTQAQERVGPRAEKEATDDTGAFSTALDQAQSRELSPKAEAAPGEQETAPSEEDALTIETALPERETSLPSELGLLLMPSAPPAPPPTTQAYRLDGAPPARAFVAETSPTTPLEIEVDLSAIDRSTPPPISSTPPAHRGLGALTDAELASGFSLPWPSAVTSSSAPPTALVPSTVPVPMTQASPGVEAPLATSEETRSFAPRADDLDTELAARFASDDAHDRPTAPAPHRAPIGDAALRDAVHRSSQPVEVATETPDGMDQAEDDLSLALEAGAEATEAAEPATRRAATPKAFASSEPSQLRERLASPRVHASAATVELADEQVQRRQEAATSAVNHMTLRHFAQADIDHPELGRIRVAARNVSGEVDVEMKARDAGTVAVLQSTSAQLGTELRQAHVELRDLNVSQDDGSAPGHSEERRGEQTDERAPQRDGQSNATPRTAQDDEPEVVTSSGSSVRIVL